MVGLQKLDMHEEIITQVLLDCRATGLFMHPRFAGKMGFNLQKLEFPIKVRNIDGTWNQVGEITHETTLILNYEFHLEWVTFKICDLGKNDVILGMTWLQKHNPEIDWDNGHVKMTRCPWSCGQHAKEYLEKRKATRWELWEFVKAKEKENEFKEYRGWLDFIQSKGEKYEEMYLRSAKMEELVPKRITTILNSIWQKGFWMNANKETLGSCN